MRCQVCGGAPADLACSGCGALCYCTDHHLQLRQRCGHDARECQRMRQQLTRVQDLLHHDLQWPCIKGPSDLHSWLQQLGCHTQGLLQHCCQLPPSSNPEQQPQPEGMPQAATTCLGPPDALPTTQQEWQRVWGLAGPGQVPAWGGGSCSLHTTHQPPPNSWPEYYATRCMDPSSPAALALHFPLTLWHCLVQLLPSRGWALPPAGATLRVAVLGPQLELQQLAVFVELALLLPHHQLELHFVGPDVPDQLHRRACHVQLQQQHAACTHDVAGSLVIACWVGCWHDALDDWAHASTHEGLQNAAAAHQEPVAPGTSWRAAQAPTGPFHLVFAANAGLPVYPSWLPSLQQLACTAPHALHATVAGAGMHAGSGGSKRVPVLFTDYCEEAAHKSQVLVVQLLGRQFNLAGHLNPFRCPAPASSHGTHLPACSNGFLFGWL